MAREGRGDGKGWGGLGHDGIDGDGDTQRRRCRGAVGRLPGDGINKSCVLGGRRSREDGRVLSRGGGQVRRVEGIGGRRERGRRELEAGEQRELGARQPDGARQATWLGSWASGS